MCDSKDLNLTFSGCGFLGIYHLGVVSCLKDNAPAFLDRVKCFGGTSAGAFAATALLMDLNLTESAEFVLRLAKRAQSLTLGPLHPNFRIVDTVRKSFEKILPENAHEIASDRLHISLTRVSDFKNVIVSEFLSKEDLIQGLLASSHVPFYSSIMPAKFRGIYYVDGGITDNLIQHFTEGETITVSPFSGESDICPKDGSANFAHLEMKNTSVQFTLQNLYRCSRAFFPPEVEVLCEMCKQGYRDTMRFLQTQYPETLSNEVFRKKSSSLFMPSGVPFGKQDSSIMMIRPEVVKSHRARSYSTSSTLSAYSTCSNGEAETFETSECEQDDIVEGECRLSVMLDRTQEAITEAELWSCYFIRKVMWVLKLAAKPCVLSVKQITYMAHVVLESLPVIEKTGIEFMDHLLSMIYVMIHTYKDKHMVHHRKLTVAVPSGQQAAQVTSFMPTKGIIQQASLELIHRLREDTSIHTVSTIQPMLPSDDNLQSLESSGNSSQNSDIEIIHDESFSSRTSGYDLCDKHLNISFNDFRNISDEQLNIELGQWESEGGACPDSQPCQSSSTSDDYIILNGYETDIESISSGDAEDDFLTSLDSNIQKDIHVDF